MSVSRPSGRCGWRCYPRVHRSWTFAGLRAFSNGLLRDLNTAVVAEEMMRGARSVYVDYVDYDEIAHHAGATRVESLAALGGLDQVLAHPGAGRRPRAAPLPPRGPERPRAVAGRAVRRALRDLAERPLRSLTHSETRGLESSIEGWGRVDSVLEDLAGSKDGGVPQAASRRVDKKLEPNATTETTPS